MKKYIKAAKLNKYGELEIEIPAKLFNIGVDKFEILDFLGMYPDLYEIRDGWNIEGDTLYIEISDYSINLDDYKKLVEETLELLFNEVVAGR